VQAQQATLTTQGVPPQRTEQGRLPDTLDSPHKAPAEEASSMPILAVTLGADDNATASQAADSTIAEVVSAVGVPMVSETMRAEIMQLIWANFEVRNSRFQVGFKFVTSSSHEHHCDSDQNLCWSWSESFCLEGVLSNCV